MAYAGFFIGLGVLTLGSRVIRTMGTELTHVDYLMGFVTELATTISVVLASIYGLPVSTTHSQVGAIVFVGLVSAGPKGVSWRLFGRIGASWILTIPFAGSLAAILTAMLRPAVTN